MKNLILLLLVMLCSVNITAQNNQVSESTNPELLKYSENEQEMPKTFINTIRSKHSKDKYLVEASSESVCIKHGNNKSLSELNRLHSKYYKIGWYCYVGGAASSAILISLGSGHSAISSKYNCAASVVGGACVLTGVVFHLMSAKKQFQINRKTQLILTGNGLKLNF